MSSRPRQSMSIPVPLDGSLEYDFDQAWDDLGRSNTLWSDDDDFREAYARALVRLPEDVRLFALDRITFLTIGKVPAICWPSSIIDRRSRKWLILIDEKYDGDMESQLAHEIAHARLGHDRLSPDIDHSCEKQADDLSVTWGFARCYPAEG